MYFSRHWYSCSSLSYLAQLDSDCVCACSCAVMCIYACQSLKFEAGTMVVMVPWQYFQLMNCEGSAVQRSPGNIIFASCRSIGRVSWFLVGLAVVPQLWQENLPCFCRVRRLLTYCLHIVAELIVSAINNLKMMGWRAHCVWAASYFIDHGSCFPYILYGKGEQADPQRGVAVIMWSYSAHHH